MQSVRPIGEVPGMIEIARSFSYKLNVGNYESRDFFCSQKSECRDEVAEEMSAALHNFCKKQVMLAVAEYIKEAKAKGER